MNYKRLLVLSNNSFSTTNSNGRTLGSLLKGWPKDKIAQFCISAQNPDFEVCNNYYCISDGDIIKSVLRLKPAKRRKLEDMQNVNFNRCGNHVRYNKTSLKMIFRNLLWKSGIWKGEDFKKWIKDFSPEIVLLQNGESFFMHDLAMDIANDNFAELAIFNTEGFYLFKQDYFLQDSFWGRNVFFKLYHRIYKRHFERFMGKCIKQVYGNESLKRDYDTSFGDSNSCVLYTSSNFDFIPNAFIPEIPTFSYIGNLGLKRIDAIIELSNIVNSIDKRFKLDVYGAVSSVEMEEVLRTSKNINFHGWIEAFEVKQVIMNSNFLIHVESQDDDLKEFLKYGFSTKIADSISSGKIFILYSSKDIACYKYLEDNHAGIFSSDKSEIKKLILEVLNSKSLRLKIENNARNVALLNHNSETNTQRLKEYLLQ